MRWGIVAGIALVVGFVLLAVLQQTGVIHLDRVGTDPVAEEPLFDEHMQPTARFCRENPRNCTPYVPPTPTGSPPPRPGTR